MAVRRLRAIFNPQLQQHAFPYGKHIDFLFLSFLVILIHIPILLMCFIVCHDWALFLFERRDTVNLKGYVMWQIQRCLTQILLKRAYIRLWGGMPSTEMQLRVLARHLGTHMPITYHTTQKLPVSFCMGMSWKKPAQKQYYEGRSYHTLGTVCISIQRLFFFFFLPCVSCRENPWVWGPRSGAGVAAANSTYSDPLADSAIPTPTSLVDSGISAWSTERRFTWQT